MNKIDHLDKQATGRARYYMGRVAWPTVVLAIGLTVSYVGTIAMVLGKSWSLWVGVPLAAWIVYMSYTVLHESVHGSICGNRRSLRWLNATLGYIAGWITMIPRTAHRYEHIAHHRFANDAARDPDFHIGSMCDSWFAPVRTVWSAWISQFSSYGRERWAAAPMRERLALCLEVAAALIPRLALALAGYWVEALALFVVAWMLGAFVLLFLFAYIVHRPYESVGRYADSATILSPEGGVRWLDWVWMFQNYHSIHHLFPRVPFYAYPKLYDEIAAILKAKQVPIYGLSLRGLDPVSVEGGGTGQAIRSDGGSLAGDRQG